MGVSASTDGIARLGALVDTQEWYQPVIGQRSENQHLAFEAGDVARREVDNGNDEPANQRARIRVRQRQSRRRAARAMRTNIHRQAIGRHTGSGELLDLDNAPDTHVDLVEVGDGGAARSLKVSHQSPSKSV